jgi:predicted dehydrogenase
VDDPRTAPPLRWGILGTGGIAAKFAAAVRAHTRGEVVAVGSREAARAGAFAAAHGVTGAHGSYAALVADPAVEAVYVATPHSEHRDHALLAIGAGRHVLVEKAFTRNEAEAREVLDAAGAAGVFAMEAMWTRFLPHVAALHRVLEEGRIGQVVSLSADHGQWFAFDARHRLFAPELGGGALLDLGVYPVSFAHDLLGPPEAVRAAGVLAETGVDGQVSAVLGYGGQTQAVVSATLWSQTPTRAAISGTEGRIEVEGRFYGASSFTVTRRDGESWTFSHPLAKGLEYEAAEVARRVAAGERESPRMSWRGTLEVMHTLDEIRAQIGVAYPGE